MKTIKEYLSEGLIKRQAGVDMRTKIETWLKEYNITSYTINKDSTIDVDGYVHLTGYKENQLPDYIQFREVTGAFDCSDCSKLESLKGVPQKVDGDFDCSGCSKLKSLEGCPKEVGRNFYCNSCPDIESLKGSPRKVGRIFNCSHCSKLKSLEGAPREVGGIFYCRSCDIQFTEDDVKKLCEVKGNIIV